MAQMGNQQLERGQPPLRPSRRRKPPAPVGSVPFWAIEHACRRARASDQRLERGLGRGVLGAQTPEIEKKADRL